MRKLHEIELPEVTPQDPFEQQPTLRKSNSFLIYLGLMIQKNFLIYKR